MVDYAAKAGEDDDVDWLAEAELDYDGIVPPPMPNLTCGDRELRKATYQAAKG